MQRGRSSVVERHLAKVDVVSSNLIARSIFRFRAGSFHRRYMSYGGQDEWQAMVKAEGSE